MTSAVLAGSHWHKDISPYGDTQTLSMLRYNTAERWPVQDLFPFVDERPLIQFVVFSLAHSLAELCFALSVDGSMNINEIVIPHYFTLEQL